MRHLCPPDLFDIFNEGRFIFLTRPFLVQISKSSEILKPEFEISRTLQQLSKFRTCSPAGSLERIHLRKFGNLTFPDDVSRDFHCRRGSENLEDTAAFILVVYVLNVVEATLYFWLHISIFKFVTTYFFRISLKLGERRGALLVRRRTVVVHLIILHCSVRKLRPVLDFVDKLCEVWSVSIPSLLST